MKIALGIEYDGTRYCGWQAQKTDPSVQITLETALAKIATHPVRVHCAGRTDAGVHARGQVIHFETTTERQERAWVFGANSYLPPDIRVHWAKPVPDHFHARFSATARRYQYRILNQRVKSAIERNYTCWECRPLTVERMQAAAQHLVGEHDFNAFRSSECQAKTSVRQVHAIDVKRTANVITLDITANAFLHHMVRNIAGSLIKVGRGEENSDWIKTVLAACDRRLAGMTAVAEGLVFFSVKYPDEFAIPNMSSI